MAEAAVTSTNAPREVKGLMNLGRYSLRNLAYELGLVTKEAPESVTAFDKESLEIRATRILEGLTLTDKEKSGNGKSKKTREPAKAKEPTKTREPAKTKTATPPNETAATPGEMTTVLKVLAGLAGRLDEIEAKVDENHDDLVDVRKGVMSNLGLNAIMGEQIMQGSTIDDLVKDGIEIGASIKLPEDEAEGEA